MSNEFDSGRGSAWWAWKAPRMDTNPLRCSEWKQTVLDGPFIFRVDIP